jgi:hypothetical protein
MSARRRRERACRRDVSLRASSDVACASAQMSRDVMRDCGVLLRKICRQRDETC